MSKIENTKKRFTQGRITYKKMDELLKKYHQEILNTAQSAFLNDTKVDVDALSSDQEQEHIHSEHCNHNHNTPELMPEPEEQ